MNKKFLFVLLLLVVLPAYASHIVGGEFELLHISGNTYRLNLIYYFDVLHNTFGGTPPEDLEPSLTVAFFRKSNNTYIFSLTLPFQSKTRVSYTQPACSSGQIVTDKLIYSTDFELSPDVFNEPEGYYISWQRCCRNYEITNIYSQPIGDGIYAGQTFYLEFPPVVKDGQPFINSSPHLFPPLNDYACPGRPYFVNFAGVDDDGDSIAYSLTTPLNITAGVTIPDPTSAPYPLVTWRPGYDSLHMIGGSPDLRISTTGLLTCTPTKPGLFVFAVKAQEFRSGVKIGETRRDFQMLVVSGCQPAQPPFITGKKLQDASFTYVDTMSVNFPDTVANGDRCIVVRVSDPDSQDPLQNFTENIKIRAIPLGFQANVSSVLPAVTSATLINGSTKDFMICFQLCPEVKSPFQLAIIAYDDACSLPLTDTLRITVNDSRPPNTSPYFLPLKLTTAQLNETEHGSWPFAARDNDGDNLIFTVVPDGFVLADAGMTFNLINQKPGKANGTIDWNAFCKIYDFTKKTDFTVKVLVDDEDACDVARYDTVVFQLKVVLPVIDPHLKILDNTTSQDVTSVSLNRSLGHLEFNIIGTDANPLPNDTLRLSLLNAGSLPGGYSFTPATGVHLVESKFTWDPTCAIFKDGDYSNDYTFKFSVVNDHCREPKMDTAFVKVTIKDIESSDKNFIPANVITTYPDHCNDFFAIEGFEDEPSCNGQIREAPLPPADNCSNRFERVKIYDRWGKLVFESEDRKFRWYASSESAGVYYYIIDFTKRQFKSSLTVVH